jgi:hypothetical protein
MKDPQLDVLAAEPAEASAHRYFVREKLKLALQAH